MRTDRIYAQLIRMISANLLRLRERGATAERIAEEEAALVAFKKERWRVYLSQRNK